MEYEEIFGLNQIKLFISEEHRFGTDSMLLGEYAGKTKSNTAVDLCSGSGIIPAMLVARAPHPPQKIYAVEVQAPAAELIRRTARHNNIGCLEVIHGDLRDEGTLSRMGREKADLVTANPPYYTKGSGHQRRSPSQKTARYENASESAGADSDGIASCTLQEVVAAAAYLLKYGGTLKMCMTAPRLAECIAIMRERGIEPKEIVLIAAKKTATARLFLINGKKGGKSGVKVLWR